jgi:hypothetical protein
MKRHQYGKGVANDAKNDSSKSRGQRIANEIAAKEALREKITAVCLTADQTATRKSLRTPAVLGMVDAQAIASAR